jgi:hypothetical protein
LAFLDDLKCRSSVPQRGREVGLQELSNLSLVHSSERKLAFALGTGLEPLKPHLHLRKTCGEARGERLIV